MKPSGQLRRTALHRTTPLPARSTPIAQVSAKRRRVNRVRAAVLADLGLERGPGCEVPWCADPWQDGHEPGLRSHGASIVDPDQILLICRRHHDEIHVHRPAWAFEYGFLLRPWERQR